MIHLINTKEAAAPLEAAFALDENLRGELLVLHDHLGIGPILNSQGLSHDAMRNAYWHSLPNPVLTEPLQDEANLYRIIEKAREEDEPVCFWMAPNADDICMYYWLLPYFKSYPGMLHTISIGGLPFLNAKGQLFYPQHFGMIEPREFIKTKKLLKQVTPSEFEMDGEEWNRQGAVDTGLRMYEGGKKILAKPIDSLDHHLKSFLNTGWQKASRIVQEAVKKSGQLMNPFFAELRLRALIQEAYFQYKGDLSKPLREVEICIAGEA